VFKKKTVSSNKTKKDSPGKRKNIPEVKQKQKNK
jgi:hypothetical protein